MIEGVTLVGETAMVEGEVHQGMALNRRPLKLGPYQQSPVFTQFICRFILSRLASSRISMIAIGVLEYVKYVAFEKVLVVLLCLNCSATMVCPPPKSLH